MRQCSTLRRLAWLAVAASAAWLPAQSFDLDRGREPVVSLDGLWRFQPGDSPQIPAAPPANEQDGEKQPGGKQALLWAQPGFDDSKWPLLLSGRDFSSQGYSGLSGYAWYRFTVTIPAGDKPTSLLLAPIITSYQVYVDGTLVGGSGKMPTNFPNTLISYHIFPLTQSGSAVYRTVHVAIRVWHSPLWASYAGGGPFFSGHLAGDPKLLEKEQRHHQITRNAAYVDAYSYTITATLVGIAILCLFFFRPAEFEYLWFALMLLAQAADIALLVAKQVFSWPSLITYDLSDGILVAVTIISALYFFSIVLKVRIGLAARIFVALAAFSPIPAILYWPGWLDGAASSAVQICCLIPAIAWILYVLIARSITGNLDARLLLFPTLLDLGYYLADNVAIVFGQAGWITAPYVLETSIPIPPFAIRSGILLHLVFLLALLVFLIRRFSMARRKEEHMASEFEAARQVQLILMPDQLDQCPGFTVESIYEPAEQVGGDFFQQMADSRGGMLIVVGDVSGKGLPAAMMVSVLVGAIRAEATHSSDPAGMLTSLNQRMMGRSSGGFTTCMAAHLTCNGLLTLSNAGHLPPYLNGREIDIPGSLPLGILPGVRYENLQVQLNPGDRLTFVSDGVVEAQSKAHPKSARKSTDLFGFDRTRDLSLRPAAEIAEAARLFGQTDDITVVTVEFSGVPALAESRYSKS
ncbi:MAG: PP2C family protein-serine/threonine phosphatase [Terracidiphilus sp.]